MGHAMAGNLLKNNVELTVFNRTKEKADDLVEQGARWGDSAAEAVKNADVVFTMLSEPAVVREVAFGKDGFVGSMQADALWVDSSTVNPSFSREMAEKARQAMVRFMDAPVAGSKVPAQNGELVYLVGGEKKDLDQVSNLLDIMGKKTVHVGKTGLGTSMKMVVNMMLAQSMLAFSESVHLGMSLGIDRNFVLESLSGMPVSAPFLSYKAGRMKDDNFEVEFPLEWMQKDMHLATLSGWEQGIALPSANLSKEIYALAKQSGLSREDFSAVFKLLNAKK